MAKTRILILGGTGDSARLIPQLAALPQVEPIASLAGRTPKPNIPTIAQVRMGGFGGVEGLVNYLKTERIDLLLDMTHPFAAQITYHAALAAHAVDIPRLVFSRPAWEQHPDDRWVFAQDLATAALLFPQMADRVFLTIGRQELSAFAKVRDCWFLMRMITPPAMDQPLPRGQILLDQGPFDVEKEIQLLQSYNIRAIVSKNSGGNAAYAKMIAARHLGIPVVMIPRPPLPPGEIVQDLEAVMSWVMAHCLCP